jgi:hypothetical protein
MTILGMARTFWNVLREERPVPSFGVRVPLEVSLF